MTANFSKLVDLMARLRSPEGCPWDREQTYATLAPMLLEEAYEAFDAVEAACEGRPAELRDELGDLLFQIVFFAQVAQDRGEFSMTDVTNAIYEKMVRRHPHVFGTVQASSSNEVLRNWEAIKAEEKRVAQKSGSDEAPFLLEGVSRRVPALMEAHQLSTKAARVGFDWERIDDVFEKLQEEIQELRTAMERHSTSQTESDHSRVREEIGDVLFAVTNIARRLQIEPESALKLTNRKFRGRFRHIEESLHSTGRKFASTSLAELEDLWQEAKNRDALASG